MTSYHDQNGTPTLLAVENDGQTLVNIEADSSSHRLSTSDGITGSDNGPSESFHDGNNVPIFMATSNLDGETPVAVYGNPSGALLIDSI